MSSKIGLKLTKKYSLNFSLPKRTKDKIKFVILHYTGMKNELSAINRLRNPKSKVSAHYFIKKNGQVINLVPDLYEAWHAGKSNWKKFKSLNKYSIGIELTNPGHQYGYKKFSSQQILSLKKLLKYLIEKYRIDYKFVLGHSDISPNRKKDKFVSLYVNDLEDLVVQSNIWIYGHTHYNTDKKVGNCRVISNQLLKNTDINMPKLIEINPNEQFSYLSRGRILGFIRRYHEAIDDFSRVIAINPEYWFPYSARGIANNALEDYSSALRHYWSSWKLSSSKDMFALAEVSCLHIIDIGLTDVNDLTELLDEQVASAVPRPRSQKSDASINSKDLQEVVEWITPRSILDLNGTHRPDLSLIIEAHKILGIDLPSELIDNILSIQDPDVEKLLQ